MRHATRLVAALAATIVLAACAAGAGSSGPPGGGSAPSSQPTASVAPSTEVSPMPTTSSSVPSPSAGGSAQPGPFQLTSSAFADGGAIPRELTCDGPGMSPQLAWTGVPAGTAALVLLVDDPDARDFVHWIVLDLPGTDSELAAGLAPNAPSPQQGTNDFGKVGWGGPCPPSGTHRYRFTLSALSARLELDGHPGGDAVRGALKAKASSVLGTAVLTGTYQRR